MQFTYKIFTYKIYQIIDTNLMFLSLWTDAFYVIILWQLTISPTISRGYSLGKITDLIFFQEN